MGNKSTTTTKETPRKILCFGDSLTAGYTNNGKSFYPYSRTLEDSLREHEPDVTVATQDITVVSSGGNGITAAMLASRHNLNSEHNVDVCAKTYIGLKKAIEIHHPILVILMAGTNDLAKPSSTVDVIMKSIIKLHTTCHKAGISTIACSVPPNRVSTSSKEDVAMSQPASLQEYIHNWKQLNLQIKQWASNNVEQSCYFDVEESIAYFPESNNWELDGLHMSIKGYARLGEKLAPLVRAKMNPI